MTGKRSIRRTVRGSLCGYVGRRFWANFGEAFDPAAERRAAEWLNRYEGLAVRYRITASVIRDGQPFITEPEFGPTVDDAKISLLQWIRDCGWEFVAWHDLVQIDTDPFGAIKVTAVQLRGNIADKMNGFIPGLVEGQVEFYHVAEDGAVTRWWLVPGSYGPNSYGPAADHPLGWNPRPGWYDSNARPLPCDPREAAQ